MLRLVFLALLCVFTLGCAKHRIGSSFVGDVPQENVQIMANTAADIVAKLHAPGRTTLYLEKSQSKVSTPFDTIFEKALRSKGFSLAQTSSSESITIGYTVDVLNQDEDVADVPLCYFQLRLSDGKSFARMFTLGGKAQAVTTVLGVRP